MIGLDTNVLLRWLVDPTAWPDDDRGQTQSVANLIETPGETFFVNVVVLAETAWVLQTKLHQPKAILIELMERLLRLSNVVIDQRRVLVAALDGFQTGQPGLADRLIGEINRHAGCTTTVSFDKGTQRSALFRRLTPVKN